MRPVRGWAPLLVLVLAVTGGGLPVGLTSSAVAAPAPRVVLHANQTDARPGEAVLFRGRVLAGSRPLAGVRVVLQSRAPGRRFRALERRRTGGNGRFSFARVPAGPRDFRVRFVGHNRPNALSPVRAVTRSNTARTLAQRTDQVRSYVGQRQSGPTTSTRFGTSVQHARHARGTIATVGRDTWVVRGPIGARYADLRGVDGRLGAPLHDQKCQQVGAVCVQRFQKGAIAHDPQAPTKVTHAFGHPDRAAYRAVALAYVNYREPEVRQSKFNDWIGNNRAWCGFFNAWASRASANGDAFPKAQRFGDQVAIIRSRGGQLRRPRPGAFMLIDRGNKGRPTHAGIIIKVRRNGDVVTIDGNAPMPGGPRSGPRYVVRRSQDTSQAVMYWRPPSW
ncbi:MAG: carboxypeptidase-like regulatory domain-containing protein [Nocardioides sp.]|nr:carboxypeptidase-like regulatory domain-containing protein [Nocardioides sp.]